jgi:hypothetical protein
MEPYFSAEQMKAYALAAVAAQPLAGAVSEVWQPIETAPKDGVHVLLGRFPEVGNGVTHIGHCAVDWWRQHKDAAGYLGWGKFNATYWPPTHWMPLPAAPSIGTTSQGVDHG